MFSIEEALSVFKREYPESKPIKYAKLKNGYLIVTKYTPGLLECNYYIVDTRKVITPTNPYLCKANSLKFFNV